VATTTRVVVMAGVVSEACIAKNPA
jgi:hypothetical protein